jgi:hypothetical protein
MGASVGTGVSPTADGSVAADKEAQANDVVRTQAATRRQAGAFRLADMAMRILKR